MMACYIPDRAQSGSEELERVNRESLAALSAVTFAVGAEGRASKTAQEIPRIVIQ